MLEVGKYYNTEAKNLRATGLTVNKEGNTVSRPLYSYWNLSCVITLRCEYIHDDVVIFREFNTSKLVYGVDDILKASKKYDINNVNYDDIKNELNEKLLWVSKGDVHEIVKDNVRNNVEAVKSIDFLTNIAETSIEKDLDDLFDNPHDHVNAKRIQLKR